jgi:hypothetical protein
MELLLYEGDLVTGRTPSQFIHHFRNLYVPMIIDPHAIPDPHGKQGRGKGYLCDSIVCNKSGYKGQNLDGRVTLLPARGMVMTRCRLREHRA